MHTCWLILNSKKILIKNKTPFISEDSKWYAVE